MAKPDDPHLGLVPRRRPLGRRSSFLGIALDDRHDRLRPDAQIGAIGGSVRTWMIRAREDVEAVSPGVAPSSRPDERSGDHTPTGGGPSAPSAREGQPGITAPSAVAGRTRLDVCFAWAEDVSEDHRLQSGQRSCGVAVHACADSAPAGFRDMRRLAAIRAYGGSMVILNGRAADHVVVEGIAQRRRLQQLLEQLRVITHEALLAPVGRVAREALASWGLPEPSLDHLEIGYFPDRAVLAWELCRRGALASEVAGAGLLEPCWSGRVVGPWRNPRGRIVTFFAWQPENADRSQRYVWGPGERPQTLYGQSRAMSLTAPHVCVVEGLLDVLLASCLGMDDVLALGGPMWRLSVQQLASLAASGIGEATLMPPDDEEGRLGVLTVLENADSQGSPAVDVFVVDPAMMWGARDLGELVRKRGGQALAEVRASRMEGDVYRVVMVPW